MTTGSSRLNLKRLGAEVLAWIRRMSPHSGISFYRVIYKFKPAKAYKILCVSLQLATLGHLPSSISVSDSLQTPSLNPSYPISCVRSAIFLQDKRPCPKNCSSIRKSALRKCTYHEWVPRSRYPYPKIHLA